MLAYGVIDMTPRDEFIRAIYGEEVDTVPLYEGWINNPVVERVTGQKPKDIFDTMRFYKMLGLGGFPVWDSLPSETAIAEKGMVIDEWGRKWRFSPEGLGFWAGTTINTPEDLEHFTPPDPLSPERVKLFENAVKEANGQIAVVAGLHEAFEIPSLMIGQEKFLLCLYKNPIFAQKLIDLSIKYNTELTKAAIDAGVDVVVSGDDYAFKDGPYVSPKLFERFFLPHIKNMANLVKRRGIPFVKHCDGNIWRLLDYFVSCGADGVHALEPQAGMDIVRVKQEYGDKICLMGNVDCTSLLPHGTADEVVREVRRCIDSAAPGGGYIMGSSNSIHNSVKVENFLTIVKETKRYGRYSTIG